MYHSRLARRVAHVSWRCNNAPKGWGLRQQNFPAISARPFYSFGRRCTAHSVLAKCGLGPDWLPSQQLELHDFNDTLFSKRLVYDEQEIRLLYIMPSDDPTSTIEMVMAHCNLGKHPPYEALSYTGGNPFSSPPPSPNPSKKSKHHTEDPWEKKTNVLVNDIPFPVKKNLMDALQRFRITHANKAMWIDSICINEADPVERGEQVRLMGDVYGAAEDVPIWLGETEPGVRTALRLITNIIKAFTEWYDREYSLDFQKQWEKIIRRAETTPDALDQSFFWDWLQSPKCQPFFENIDLNALVIRTDYMAWDFLRDLLMRRWFDRVWTWQEKELARKATIYIGDRIFSWAELRFAMLLVMGHDLSKTRATPSVMMPGREYLRVLDSLSVGKSPDLLDIVMNVRHRDTQLRRDKIFGVIGAAARYQDKSSPDVQHFSRLVNYGYLTTEDLYKEFSRYWILEKRDLRVLQACNPHKKKIEQLPSWVVDWTDITPSHQLTSRLYDASKGREDLDVKYHYHLNSDELHLKGVSIDKVKFVFNDKTIDRYERELKHTTMFHADHWRSRLVQPLASLYTAGIGAQKIDLLPRGWREAMQQDEWREEYPPTGQSEREAFWRTLLSDQSPYVTNATDRRIPADTDLVSVFDRWAHRRALTPSLLPESMRRRKEAEVSQQRWLEALHQSVINKRFYITQAGYMGLAPKHIQVGDHICVFFGGKVPFALRKEKNADWYTLVEEAYLHGFMDGEAIEALERGDLEEGWFKIR